MTFQELRPESLSVEQIERVATALTLGELPQMRTEARGPILVVYVSIAGVVHAIISASEEMHNLEGWDPPERRPIWDMWVPDQHNAGHWTWHRTWQVSDVIRGSLLSMTGLAPSMPFRILLVDHIQEFFGGWRLPGKPFA